MMPMWASRALRTRKVTVIAHRQIQPLQVLLPHPPQARRLLLKRRLQVLVLQLARRGLLLVVRRSKFDSITCNTFCDVLTEL